MKSFIWNQFPGPLPLVGKRLGITRKFLVTLLVSSSQGLEFEGRVQPDLKELAKIQSQLTPQGALRGSRCPVTGTGPAKKDVPCGDGGRATPGVGGPHSGAFESVFSVQHTPLMNTCGFF